MSSSTRHQRRSRSRSRSVSLEDPDRVIKARLHKCTRKQLESIRAACAELIEQHIHAEYAEREAERNAEREREEERDPAIRAARQQLYKEAARLWKHADMSDWYFNTDYDDDDTYVYCISGMLHEVDGDKMSVMKECLRKAMEVAGYDAKQWTVLGDAVDAASGARLQCIRDDECAYTTRSRADKAYAPLSIPVLFTDLGPFCDLCLADMDMMNLACDMDMDGEVAYFYTHLVENKLHRLH